MSQEHLAFGNTWLVHHPGWTMHTWTDAFLPRLHNERAFKQSTALSGKANILRYEILLRHGGVYIDTDFECLRNIEPLLHNVSCFVGLQSTGLANNAVLGAVPDHPFIRDLVIHIPSRERGFSQPSIKQSGPYYLTKRLNGRSDVTVFPPECFYPYQWHERWKRHEHFPEAYAAHHWSLSWRGVGKSKPCSIKPKASVVIISNAEGDAKRLEWVLEGLCEQTMSGAFEVIVMDASCTDRICRLTHRYSQKLLITYVAAHHTHRDSLTAEVQQRCLSLCRALRIVILDGHCVPDKDVVEIHSRWGSRPVVAFSAQRLYPPEKMYEFVAPLDYDAMKIHSIVDPRCHLFNGQGRESDLRALVGCCISLPRQIFKEMVSASDRVLRHGAGWFAHELSARGLDMVALQKEACVTWLRT